nr:MAG TPA: hypothetical protein [Caudoviricetes sp.]
MGSHKRLEDCLTRKHWGRAGLVQRVLWQINHKEVLLCIGSQFEPVLNAVRCTLRH